MLSFVKTCLTVILDIRFRFLLYILYSVFNVHGRPPIIKAGACTLSGTGGGEYRVRTCDPLRARQVLSQLS